MLKHSPELNLLLQQVQQQFLSLAPAQAQSRYHFLVGVSGGADSLLLLYLIASLQQQYPDYIKVTALHVNHQLSSHAHRWQQHVAAISEDLGVDCIVESVSISGRNNLEAKARDARYDVFQRYLSFNLSPNVKQMLVLGHHADDMAEDFFLKLMRSSGVGALAGKQNLEVHFLAFNVWRPLLQSGKADIERLLHETGIEPVFDESNLDRVFSRNFIRHEIMPVLQSRWPDAVARIRKTQKWCMESEALSADLAEIDWQKLIKRISPAQVQSINIKGLAVLPPHRFKNLMRYFLRLNGIAQFRESLLREAMNLAVSQSGCKVQGQQPQILVSKKQQIYLTVASGALMLYRRFDLQSHVSVNDSKNILGVFGLELASHGQFEQTDYPHRLVLQVPDWVMGLENQSGAFWKVPASSEKLKLDTKPYPMPFKKLWQEWKVPVCLRARWPVLYDHQGKIICVPMIWSEE